MLLPPYGVCVPAEYRRAVDGKTIELRVGRAGLAFTVELLDCDCPGLAEQQDQAARAAADAILGEADQVSVCAPLTADPAAILAALAPDRRLAGHVFVDGDTTLTQHLIRRGLAERRATR